MNFKKHYFTNGVTQAVARVRGSFVVLVDKTRTIGQLAWWRERGGGHSTDYCCRSANYRRPHSSASSAFFRSIGSNNKRNLMSFVRSKFAEIAVKL